MSFLSVLFFVLMVLKLTHVIVLSWWWVTAPLWAGFPLVFFICFVFTVVNYLVDGGKR